MTTLCLQVRATLSHRKVPVHTLFVREWPGFSLYDEGLDKLMVAFFWRFEQWKRQDGNPPRTLLAYGADDGYLCFAATMEEHAGEWSGTYQGEPSKTATGTFRRVLTDLKGHYLRSAVMTSTSEGFTYPYAKGATCPPWSVIDVQPTGRPRLLTQQESRQAMSDVAAGATVVAVADDADVHRNTVQNRLTIGRRPRRPDFTDEDRVALVGARAEGQTLSELAETFGTTDETIRRQLRKAGVAPQKRGRPPLIPVQVVEPAPPPEPPAPGDGFEAQTRRMIADAEAERLAVEQQIERLRESAVAIKENIRALQIVLALYQAR